MLLGDFLAGQPLAESRRHRFEFGERGAADGSVARAVLRDEVIPLYYDRDRDGLPRRWIARMKRAIRTLGWRFSADRMLTDYVLKAYIPAAGGTSSEMRS